MVHRTRAVFFNRFPCKISAVIGLLLFACAGCNMDEGFSGETATTDLFLETQGCIKEEGEQLTVTLPFDVALVDVILEVLRSQIDLVFGEGMIPTQYFSYGPAPGIRQIRVGTGSYRPLHAGTWYVDLIGLSGETGECDPEQSPDWRLRVQRAESLTGIVLLDESCDSADCEVPECTNPGNCPSRQFSFVLPEDAVSLEVIQESLQGNADLFLGNGSEEELLSSTNPGTGYDILRINSQAIVPLRGQTLSLRLESWGQTTQEYQLRAVYVPGAVESPDPPSLP